MNLLLSDESTYEVVTVDPTRKIINGLKTHLNRWRQKGFISKSIYLSLLSSDGTLPRAYGLPKVHKDNCPLRIIVSCINSPLYKLAMFLHNVLHNSIPKPDSHIKNSFQLIDMLKDKIIDDDTDLVSLDVVSLFTNVPSELAIAGIVNRWPIISNNTLFSMEEFISAIRFVLSSTFFTFNNKIYKQTFGSPMGSPLSPILADIVMTDLELRAMENLEFSLPIYVRYVDDILTMVPRRHIEDVLRSFNSVHDRLRFTAEIGGDNINFLDITLYRGNNQFMFNWYRKPTFSGRFLNFHSQHPISHKRGVLVGLIDRVLGLSHPQFYQQNFVLIINILLNNGYPLPFIFNGIRERIKYYIYNNRRLLLDNDVNDEDNKRFFVLPYANIVSKKIKHITKKYKFRLAHTIPNKLNTFIKRHKDIAEKDSHNDIVYKISCNDCNVTYVGQSKRQLRTRVDEHRSSVRRGQNSVITEHCSRLNHNFDWDGAEICDIEHSYNKRLISEMIFIKRQLHGINVQSDTNSLPASYSHIISLLSPL
ncbi:uncharacterized protein [Linepithema humile]|uniref:uncharacterized protein n=1 Tax=Linepithema humile TaxID=83485 RepID=UPI00351E78ED